MTTAEQQALMLLAERMEDTIKTCGDALTEAMRLMGEIRKLVGLSAGNDRTIRDEIINKNLPPKFMTDNPPGNGHGYPSDQTSIIA